MIANNDECSLRQIFIEGATEGRAPLNLSTVIVYYEIVSQHTDPLKEVKPQTLTSYRYRTWSIKYYKLQL